MKRSNLRNCGHLAKPLGRFGETGMQFKSYSGKKVFVTGHTGFKGSWLCEWLILLGAEVYGYAQEPPTTPSLFNQIGLSNRLSENIIGDVRERETVASVVARIQPDFIFHLAAQPLVRLSYKQPVETFETNVMGTVHVLDACRHLTKKVNVVCVTTDKCYENQETLRPYKEDDPMGGYDPYSCSKGCDELIISSYRRSFWGCSDNNVWVASARAGNVIGGGDWAIDRIVPDCMRALERKVPIVVRNKTSTRPWQHVLEPLCGYLTLGEALDARQDYDKVAGAFNFGPNPNENRTVMDLVQEVLKHRDGQWVDRCDPNAVHEAGKLNLDIDKARMVLHWQPRWSFEKTVRATVEWYGMVADGGDPKEITQRQIHQYQGEA